MRGHCLLVLLVGAMGMGAMDDDTGDPVKAEAHRMVQESLLRAEIAKQRPSESVQRAATSGRVCALRDWRARMMKTVRKEHKYATEVGVVDLAKLQQLKLVIQAIDDALYPLEHGSTRLVRCSDATVAKLASCLDVTVTDRAGGRYHRNVPRCDAELDPYVLALGEAPSYLRPK